VAFWSSEEIDRRCLLPATPPAKEILKPFKRECVKYGSYELHLGGEAFVTAQNKGTKQTLKPGAQISIPPGQFAHLLTDEVVAIPHDTMSFISVKATLKFEGLVNVSGFHVDPGFEGRLVFSVYNAGSRSVIVEHGDALFMIWFAALDRTTSRPYKGDHVGQMSISSTLVNRLQGEVASPGQLKSSLDGLRFELRVMQALGAGFFAAILAFLPGILQSRNEKPSVPVVVQVPSTDAGLVDAQRTDFE
jgi:dCTP deaminase